jgi:biopolymer transport protein ExbB
MDQFHSERPQRLASRVIALTVILGFQTVCLAQATSAAKEQGKDAAVHVPSARDDVAGRSSSTDGAPAKAKHRQIPTTPLEIAEALGLPLLLTFLGTSVIAVWFTIERLVVLRRGRVIPRHFVERFLQNLEQGNLEPDQALALCEENGSSIALIFAHGVRKWGKSSVEVEQAIIDGGNARSASFAAICACSMPLPRSRRLWASWGRSSA